MLQTAISGHRFKVSGSLTPDAEAVFRKGLTSLLDSQARIVEIDLREVDLITSTCIGALVTLWMDLRTNKRKMKLEVSPRVKKILDMTGLTTILSMDGVTVGRATGCATRVHGPEVSRGRPAHPDRPLALEGVPQYLGTCRGSLFLVA